MQNFSQILFVMWRETVEAMLVVGILHAWLSHNPDGKPGLKYLWLGVITGLGGAFLLGLGIDALNSVLSDEGQEYFQAALMLVAAGLIVQMVFWMRSHGQRLKRDLEQSLDHSTRQQNWWGVFSLAAIAITREGSEAVLFLSSLATGSNGFGSSSFWLALGLGVALAWGTFYLLQLGGKLISWRAFFKGTEIMLLLLGCALLINGVERLIGIQTLPALLSQVWDSSALLDDGTIFGGVVSSFTGYRARPSLMVLLVFCAYWGGVQWISRPARKQAAL
ncbi:MAG: FTR1 family iron permease [Burkholderiales bacterium RIFCSPLOWO2_12_FULL_61_40]|nr:MAG: FTR1 family iron permease [Burkholderiales bacterium RIFCSPLOWO2_12_FULL_61_40]